MRNKYKNKNVIESSFKEMNSLDKNINSYKNKSEFKDINIKKIFIKKNLTLNNDNNDKNSKNEKKVPLNNLYNDLKIYKHAQIRKKLYPQPNELLPPMINNNAQKMKLLKNKPSISNTDSILDKNKEKSFIEINKEKDKNKGKEKENKSILNTIHVKKKNIQFFNKVDIRRNNNRVNNYNISQMNNNSSLKSDDNIFNYTKKKVIYHGKIKSIINKTTRNNNKFNISDVKDNTYINDKKITKSVERNNESKDILTDISSYTKTQTNLRKFPVNFKLKKTFLLFPKNEENDIYNSKTLDNDKKINTNKTNTEINNNYQNTETTLTKDNFNYDKDLDSYNNLTQTINNIENEKRKYIYINRRICNIKHNIKKADNKINKKDIAHKSLIKPNKKINIEVENGNSIKAPFDINDNNIIKRYSFLEEKQELSNNIQTDNDANLTYNNKIAINNRNMNNGKLFQSFKFLVHKAHEIEQAGDSFGNFYLKGPNSARNLQSKTKANNNLKKNEKNIFLSERDKKLNSRYEYNDNIINKDNSKERIYSNILSEEKRHYKKLTHNNYDIDNKNIDYSNKIINNNTYNTTFNFYKISQMPIDLNKNKIEHKRASSNHSNKPNNLDNLYNLTAKKISNTNKRINNINSINNTNYIVNTDYKNDNLNKEYNIDLEVLYILESKLKRLLNKINNYSLCYNECFEWINYYFNYYFYEKEINLFKLNHNRINIIYYIKIEILCYFLCYDVSFNKNFNQTGILFKTIFNLLHINFLILISFILNINDINNIKNNDNIYSIKLKDIVCNELKLKLTSQDMNENSILSLISNNFKEINNYYKMIIDNLYSYYYLINDESVNKQIHKFPNCLSLDINSLNNKQILYIISSFFFDTYRLSNNYSFEDLKDFFDIYLYKPKEKDYLIELNSQDIFDNNYKNENIYNNIYYSNNTQPNYSNNYYFFEQKNCSDGVIIDRYYLPPIKSYYKYTLVLDLDETLIYCQRDNISLYNSYNFNNMNKNTLIFRPGLLEFLHKMKSLYELVLFSFGTKEYVEHIVSLIEKKEKIFEHVLYRQYATYEKGDYVKNLELLGRDLKKIIIVDDIPHVFKLQKSNGICIKPFFGDIISDRNTLKLLGKILETIRFDAEEKDGDIIISLKRQRNLIYTHISTNLEY